MSVQPVTNAPKSVTIPSAWEGDWTDIGTADGNVPGPVLKILHTDAATGGMTYLTHLPPNWKDTGLDWHPSTEEGFVMAGDVVLNGRHLSPGCYLFRPPGILHGPVHSPNDLGCTIFQRTSATLRILRYTGTKFPHKDLQPITNEHLASDVEWSERTDTNTMQWTPVTEGGWAGASIKWVHKNKRTGGGMVMLDVPAGWSGSGSPARGSVEECVWTGDLTAGGTTFGKWGYAYRPEGEPAGTYSSETGARLICYWNGADEL